MMKLTRYEVASGDTHIYLDQCRVTPVVRTREEKIEEAKKNKDRKQTGVAVRAS